MQKCMLDILTQHEVTAKNLAKQIYKAPEKGYCEENTTKLFSDCLEGLGLKVKRNIAKTGCIATIEFGGKGPKIAVIAELDAIKCRSHPAAGPDGYAHCCGHNLQVASAYLLAAMLVEWQKEGELCGSVDIIGVPSEEYIDIAVKDDLRQKGLIQYSGGKQEMIRKGYFDHTDIALMTHNMPEDYMGAHDVVIGGMGIGFCAKKVVFNGREAHAGTHPEKGVNALNAMMIALNNINALRETFSEEKGIRVHYIVTEGGETVNIIPGCSSLEMHVRSKELESLKQVNARVNSCFQAAAMAIGCNLKITEMPGYLPSVDYSNIDQVCREVCEELVGPGHVTFGAVSGSANDFGDLSQMLTTMKIYTGGITGDLHTKEFRLINFERACVLPAKVLGQTIHELLANNAEKAGQVIRENTHNLTVERYLQVLSNFSRELEYCYMQPGGMNGTEN